VEANVESSVWSARGLVNLRELAVTVKLLEIRSENKGGIMETWLETRHLWLSTLYSQDTQNAKKLQISCSVCQITLASLSI
jgi:hypothetical protein